MNEKKAISLLGIAAKAGAVTSGGFLTERAVRSGTAKLVIIAEDASDNSFKDISHITYHYQVPTVRFSTKDALGHAIGKKDRICVAVLDQGLADAVAACIPDATTV